MPFIGVQPATVPLTSSDITDGIITGAKIETNPTISGNLTVSGTANVTGVTTLSDNIVFDASSKGVHLGVTSATASNLLDDYEEGTWTPTLTGSTSGTRALSAIKATYVKVGKIVTANLECAVDALTGTHSGYAKLGGFPFNYNGANAVACGTVGFAYVLLPSTSNIGNLSVFQNSSGQSNVFYFHSTFNNHGGGELGLSAFQDTSSMVVSVTYEVA